MGEYEKEEGGRLVEEESKKRKGKWRKGEPNRNGKRE